MGKSPRQLNVRLDEQSLRIFEDWQAARRPIPMPSKAARTLIRRGVAVDLLLARILEETLPDLMRRGILSASTTPEDFARIAGMLRESLDRTIDHELSKAAARDQGAAPRPRSVKAERR